MALTLNYRDVRDSLAELDQLLFTEARGAGWDNNPAEEKTALVTAHRLLTELAARVSERINELDIDYLNPG
ncbi:hypothetical protein [Prauserella flavalba]|uniref:hypothetical protein n=1 Tax=Prauserella flavalba TaxID=1477506 RepID=UPI0036EE8A93